MSLKFLLSIAVILTIFATTKVNAEARRLKLKALSATEVYRILKEAGREDAVPEGRSITHGIAAITGFNMGLQSALTASTLINLATSNTTSQVLSAIQSLNMTALTQMFAKGGTNSSSNGTAFQAQEICFSLVTDEQARDAGPKESVGEGKQATPTPIPPSTSSPTDSMPSTPSSTLNQTPTTATTFPTGPSTSPTTVPTSPTITPTLATPTPISPTTPPSTGPGTATGTGTGTQTGTGSSQTCIVIQKPKARKRRSSDHKIR